MLLKLMNNYTDIEKQIIKKALIDLTELATHEDQVEELIKTG